MAFVYGGSNLGNGLQRRRASRRSNVCCNLLGIHGNVFAKRLDADGVKRAVEGASAAGFDVLELNLSDPVLDAHLTRTLLRGSGITPTCSLGLSFGNDISSDDSETVQRGEDFLDDALNRADVLESDYLGGVIYSALGKYTEPASEKGLENCVGVLRRLATRAMEKGITLGLEPCNRYETNVINTLHATSQLIDRIDMPNVVIHADAYHMQIEEDDVVEAIHRNRHRIEYFHIGASNRGYLTSGSINLRSILRALAEIDYKGVITFEAFSAHLSDPRTMEALAVWHTQWSDSAEIASQARAVLRADMAAVHATLNRSQI